MPFLVLWTLYAFSKFSLHNGVSGFIPRFANQTMLKRILYIYVNSKSDHQKWKSWVQWHLQVLGAIQQGVVQFPAQVPSQQPYRLKIRGVVASTALTAGNTYKRVISINAFLSDGRDTFYRCSLKVTEDGIWKECGVRETTVTRALHFRCYRICCFVRKLYFTVCDSETI